MTIKKMKLIYWLVLSVLILVSCSDTTASDTSDNTGGGGLPAVCSETFSPTDKATLLANIATLYDQCGGNSASYSNINVSGVTDMSELFKNNTDFNGDISSWDMSGVTNVNSMFEGATKFNQDLSGWVLKAGAVVSGSNSPTKMFYFSGIHPGNLPGDNFYQYTPTTRTALKTAITTEVGMQGNEADLSIIDTSQVTAMNDLFLNNTTFNGYIATWDTSKVTDMGSMFNTAAFNQPIGNWDTSSVQNMSGMFHASTAFDQNLKNWSNASLQTSNSMFGANAPMSEANKADWMP